MPRKKLIKTNDYFYHVTTRSNHQHWFTIPMSEVWNIATNALNLAQKKFKAEIAQFVLMNNHYHMLIKTPDCDLDKFMYIFNKSFSDQLRKVSGLKNRMFGGRYNHCLVDNEKYFINVYTYIYQNPLRAQICDVSHDYPYSTLWYEARGLECPFLISKLFVVDDLFLDKINLQIKSDFSEQIKLGLRKKNFKLAQKRKY